MASVTVGNFTLSGFSAAFEGQGYDPGYNGSLFEIDPTNSDQGGSFDFNYSDVAPGPEDNDGPQVITVADTGTNDPWRLSVEITSSTGSPGDGLAYGNDFVAANNTNPATRTLTYSGFGGTNLQNLIQGLNINIGGGVNDVIGITFDLIAGSGAFTGTNVPGTEATFTSYFQAAPACYAAGTAIATPDGEVAVEALKAGDLVLTADGAMPVKWIGRRSYAAQQVAANAHLRPVMIRQGALADNVPHRDLMVSPMHSMFIDGSFIPAAALVNDVSILRTGASAAVSYIHVELDNHAVIFAEGAAAETFVDDNSRSMFDNADEFYDMFGAAAAGVFSAPRLEQGYQLDAIRRRLAMRAGAKPGPVNAGALRGHVERMVDSVIEGWVLDAAGGAPVELEVLSEGEVVATVIANRYRLDLDHAGLAGGRCGFTVAMPASVTDISQVEVRRTIDGSPLAMPKVAALAD